MITSVRLIILRTLPRGVSGPAWLASPFIRPIKPDFSGSKMPSARRLAGRCYRLDHRPLECLATAEKYRKIRNRMHMERALVRCGRAEIKRILVCRTDAIGDVAVTLPIAGFLKSVNREMHVDFLTRAYAAPVAQAAVNVDGGVLWDGADAVDWSVYDAAILAFPDAAVARQLQQSGVPIRVGTRRRWPFARFVNVHNRASRKASGRHEAWHGMDLVLSMHPVPGGIDQASVFRMIQQPGKLGRAACTALVGCGGRSEGCSGMDCTGPPSHHPARGLQQQRHQLAVGAVRGVHGGLSRSRMPGAVDRDRSRGGTLE